MSAAVQAASIALAAGFLKFTASKISPPITSEFACIKRVTKDLSLLRDIHGEISSWLQNVHGGAVDNSDPSLGWAIKLQNVADDICELLHEVHLVEALRNKTGTGGAEKYYAIAAECLTSKPKLFMYRCKIAHRIKAIKARYASIVKQRSDTKAVLTNCEVSNVRAGKPALLTNVEESEILQNDQNDGIVCESNDGDDDWIVVTKNQDQTMSPTLAGKHGTSLEQDFVNDELEPVDVEVDLQEFLRMFQGPALPQDIIAALTAIFNLEETDARDFNEMAVAAAVAEDGIADLPDGALNLQAEALQEAA